MTKTGDDDLGVALSKMQIRVATEKTMYFDGHLKMRMQRDVKYQRFQKIELRWPAAENKFPNKNHAGKKLFIHNPMVVTVKRSFPRSMLDVSNIDVKRYERYYGIDITSGDVYPGSRDNPKGCTIITRSKDITFVRQIDEIRGLRTRVQSRQWWEESFEAGYTVPDFSSIMQYHFCNGTDDYLVAVEVATAFIGSFDALWAPKVARINRYNNFHAFTFNRFSGCTAFGNPYDLSNTLFGNILKVSNVADLDENWTQEEGNEIIKKWDENDAMVGWPRIPEISGHFHYQSRVIYI
ncbi:hypothetical protein ABW20_dc0108910 [Dactylellina cionopaga]|nr:hypothetical protein ABW20_dc0108910 [Dactylellina cionopaga]